MQDKTPDPVTPPDPVALTQAQSGANLNSAAGSTAMNFVGSQTPYGSTSYAQTGSYTTPDGTQVPMWTQYTSLNDAQRGLLDQSTDLQRQALEGGSAAIGNVRNTISSPFSPEGLPSMYSQIDSGQINTTFDNPQQQRSLNPADFDRGRYEEAYLSRFNEDIANRQEDEISRLNAEGIQRGSEGYTDAMTQFDRAKTDAAAQAMIASSAEQQRAFDQALSSGQFSNQAAAQQFGQNQALAGFGNAAENQRFTQGLSAAQLQNSARNQALLEQQLLRSQPINEFATLFGLGNQIQTPAGTSGAGFGVNPADILGANSLQYNVLMNNYNQQMANANAASGAMGDIFGNVGSAAMWQI